MTGWHRIRRGHGDAGDVGSQHLEPDTRGQRWRLRALGSLEIDGHVIREPTQPAAGCEQPRGFDPVMGTNHNHRRDATFSGRQGPNPGLGTELDGVPRASERRSV